MPHTHTTTSLEVREIAFRVGASGQRVQRAAHAPAITPTVRLQMKAELKSLSKDALQLAKLL